MAVAGELHDEGVRPVSPDARAIEAANHECLRLATRVRDAQLALVKDAAAIAAAEEEAFYAQLRESQATERKMGAFKARAKVHSVSRYKKVGTTRS